MNQRQKDMVKARMEHLKARVDLLQEHKTESEVTGGERIVLYAKLQCLTAEYQFLKALLHAEKMEASNHE